MHLCLLLGNFKRPDKCFDEKILVNYHDRELSPPLYLKRSSIDLSRSLDEITIIGDLLK